MSIYRNAWRFDGKGQHDAHVYVWYQIRRAEIDAQHDAHVYAFAKEAIE